MIQIFIADPLIEIPLPVSIDQTIASQAAYVEGYDQIARAIHIGKDLNVLVTDRTVGRWLKVMASKYGPAYIHIEEVTPRRIFQQQTGISELPRNATDQQILESGLLDLKIPASPGETFEDYLLKVFFGRFIILPNSLRRVSEIVTNYEPGQWQEALRRSLVGEVYQKRIRILSQEFETEGRSAEKQMLDWIDASPQVLIRNLFALKVLSSYPEELGERVFGSVYRDLINLNLDLRKVPVVIAGNEKVLSEINLYLEKILSSLDEETLNQILNQVSGYLEVEFDAIQRLLTSRDYEITNELVNEVQDKFKTLHTSPRIAQLLADLDMLISRDPPSHPDPTWDVDTWIQWATREYLPYRYWLENTGLLDDDIGEIANAYAEWLYQNYGQLHFNSDRMVWKALLNLKEDIKTHAGPVLVVVVDNFNTKFYTDLRLAMQHQGFYEHQMDYCLSLLPSCTEVSKKSLILGHYAPFTESAYRDQVENTWTNRLGKRIKYLATISDLRSINRQQHDVYFLNYLPLDINLHLNENQLGISHSQTIRRYLTFLAQDIQSFSQRIGAERDLMVIVVSDHGSTCIPKGTVNVIQGKFYRDRAEDEHHRYIAISEEELKNLPDNSKFDCYYFDKSVYDLNKHYLVARRLYRFLPTDDHAYIHGGLTPEETLVPLAVFQPATITPKPLMITLLGPAKIYIGTKVDLQLEITNINNYPCELVSLEFIDANITAEKVNIEDIGQLDRITINVPARCPRTANGSAKKLNTHISYNFLGQPWENHIEIPVEIVEPAKAKFDLDHL